MTNNYAQFLESRTQLGGDHGFSPVWTPDFLFDFQAAILEWSLRKGRAAIFADCGLGKTPIQLSWAENVARKTRGNVLILTPLAVSAQTLREADKFAIGAEISRDGEAKTNITITNYERLHYFNPSDFAGVVCDESSILKNFNGKTKARITDFMRKIKYRMLATATAAPNDYIELGTSSEALGYLGYVDMLNKFFINNRNNSSTNRMHGQMAQWRLKGHAERPFWRWVCSWARALRKPSDLGFNDADFILPPLHENEHMVQVEKTRDGMLFNLPAVGLDEQREERRMTIEERCEKVSELINGTRPALVWCHLNKEGDLLEKLIPDAIQVKGSETDDSKESKIMAFQDGHERVLITKPKIGAWGLNFQHCNHITVFPSHSFEQYYQGVRRCWRFGQKSPVTVDVVTTEGERGVLKNLQRKAAQADEMFTNLVAEMNNELSIGRQIETGPETEVPKWL